MRPAAACRARANRDQPAPFGYSQVRLRPAFRGEIISGAHATPMPNSAKLFRLLNEFILLLLGGLLILLAVSRRIALSGRPAGFALLGIILIYWGARALASRAAKADLVQARIRAGSLIVVGLLILAIPLFPKHHAAPLLEVAGAVLVLRGLFGSMLLVQPPKKNA